MATRNCASVNMAIRRFLRRTTLSRSVETPLLVSKIFLPLELELFNNNFVWYSGKKPGGRGRSSIGAWCADATGSISYVRFFFWFLNVLRNDFVLKFCWRIGITGSFTFAIPVSVLISSFFV